MFVACAELTLLISHARSLKDKRMVARSVMDAARKKFSVSVAEVDAQDLHQRLAIGFAVVSGEADQARKMREEIVRYMENRAEDAGAEAVEVKTWEA